MALQLRQGIIFILLVCYLTATNAQIVYYPSRSSDQLKSISKDVALLLTQAIPGSNFSIKEYTSPPLTGIIFMYDSAMIGNQSCKIECNGLNKIKFSAAQDAGLSFGIYNYLNDLGFRFYLPGTLWQKIPALISPYKQLNKTVLQKFKYNSWFISGGYNKWIMDKEEIYGSIGENGNSWEQYKDRNNMNGAFRFSGHRGDIFTSDYYTTLQANPCYVASNHGERKVNSHSVPDINNIDAKDFWASVILKQYTTYKNSITSDPGLYKNFYYNFNYGNEHIGIEVPDGSRWGNTADNLGCAKGNYNGNPYPNVSDQQFLLANYTASKINNQFPQKRFQCYAYSGHADVPSDEITINKNIDVQVIASAFQTETSPGGLLNRWYKRHSNISEYEYMNIPQWTGETPIFSLNQYKNTLARIKEKKGQGLVVEASPAKFASLPFLYAGNRYLQDDISFEKSIDEFTSDMFPPNIAVHIKQLLKYWGDDNIMLGGTFINDNKNKIPLFLQELIKAVSASQNANADVKARLQELKAYVHYIVLYYDLLKRKNSYNEKIEKAANLCLYLAKINKLQLVNSYFLILDIVNKYAAESEFHKIYNINTGTAYMNGNLPSLSNEQINNNFSNDMAKYAAAVTDFKFENAIDIINKMNAANLKPVDKFNVGIGYTNGLNYSNRCEFYFYAPKAGSVNIKNTSTFEMPGYGYINFTAEAVDRPLLVIKDETVTRENNLETINIIVPSAGLYKLSVVSKFKSSCDLIISTNGNVFFKGPFYGETAENYRSDNLKSMPKYFYVPDITQLYFSINNACYTNKCLSPDAVQGAIGIKDKDGKAPAIEVSPSDSSLYKISIDRNNAGSFWQVTKMREYNFCFANISNIEIFAEPKPAVEAAPLPDLPGDMIVYPNPSNGIFTFKKNNSSFILDKINVFNSQGKKILDLSNASSINLSAMPAGVYIYSAENGNDIVKGKLIKN
jgi:hypothetical protein